MDRFQMRPGHDKDMRRALDQRRGQRLTAQTADVHAFLLTNLHGVKARWLPAHRMHAGGGDFDFPPVADQPPEKPFRNRTAADVSGTDKENAFHNIEAAQTRVSNLESNGFKSTKRLAACSERLDNKRASG